MGSIMGNVRLGRAAALVTAGCVLGSGTLAPRLAAAQVADSSSTSVSGSAGTAGAERGGFLRSPGFDAYGDPLPASAPSFSALETFGGFPPSPAGVPGGVGGRPFDWSASLGGQVLGTDNVRNTPTNRQADVGFTLLPAVQASADSQYLRGFLSYMPSLTYYANTPSQNRINNYLSANARATLIEDKLFLQLNGFGTVAATSGGYAPVGTPQVGTNNQYQTYSFQAAPYYVQRFGTLATMNVGYAYRWMDQTGSSAYAPGSSTPYFTSQTTQGNQAWMVLRSGEDFGRLLTSVRLIGTVFSGTGVFNDAHQYTGSFQAAYAINHWLSVLGEIGYEDARYSGLVPYKIEEMTWGAGARITPSPDSAIIAAARRRDGFLSPFVDVAVSVSPRLRINGNYRETLSTVGVQPLDLLNAISYDALGNPTDRFAGSPIVIPFAGTPLGALSGPLDGGIANPGGSAFGGSFLANQSSISRARYGMASISQLWERDTLTFQVFYQETTPVVVAPGTSAFKQQGTSFGVTYSHLLNEVTSLSTYLSYGRFSTANTSNTNSYTARVLLAHQFSPTIFGSVQYVYTQGGSVFGTTTGNTTQNLVIASLRKVF